MRKLFFAAVAALATIAMPITSQASFTVTYEGSGPLAANVDVDLAGAGTFSGNSVTVGSGGTITSGSLVNSYLVQSFGEGFPEFFDFTADVLGIIVSDGVDNYGIVLHPGTDAFAASLAGLAGLSGGSGIQLVADGLESHFLGVDGVTVLGSVVTFTTSLTNLDIDQFRVITAVPEPASMAVWGLAGLVGMCAYRIRRRKVA